MQSLNLAYGYLCTRPTFYIFRVERLISAARRRPSHLALCASPASRRLLLGAKMHRCQMMMLRLALAPGLTRTVTSQMFAEPRAPRSVAPLTEAHSLLVPAAADGPAHMSCGAASCPTGKLRLATQSVGYCSLPQAFGLGLAAERRWRTEAHRLRVGHYM